MNLTFYISSGVLNVIADTGRTFSLRATSGIGGCMNSSLCQTKSFEGPIPIGWYTADPKQLSDPNVLQQLNLLRYGDWGDWNIPLMPMNITNTHGRKNFYIHGGMLNGSARCIDIGGGFWGDSNTDVLKSEILKSGSINLEVRP
jgi:hypothetical protein